MRIVVVSPQADTLLLFRGDLLEAMVRLGHDVLVLVPHVDEHERRELSHLGVGIKTVPIRRTGLNPFHDVLATAALVRAIRGYGPEVVLAYAAKPVIYGLIAARIARVPLRAAIITGVGSALRPYSASRGRWLSAIVRWLYVVALKGAQVVFFQNPDDERLFQRYGLIASSTIIQRINGSGVNLERYQPTELPPPPIVFLMIARLLRDKGVHEYIAAARMVRERLPECRVQLLGGLDVNPSSITAAELAGWLSDGAIEYLGSTRDVRPYIAGAHACVLPSYGEGMPRSVLECMAMGRPAIVTDVPGCRETVEPGRNGILVPPRDAESLAAAMIELASDPQRLAHMGQESRRRCETRFDVQHVNATIMDTLGIRATVPHHSLR
jgi:glycosyltransferase involved in cell wall biosynthesis